MIKSLIFFLLILALGSIVSSYLEYLERKERRKRLSGRLAVSISDNYKMLNLQDIDFEDFIFALERVAQVLHIEMKDINITDKLSVYEVDIPFLIDSDTDTLISKISECELFKNIGSINEILIRDIIICIIELNIDTKKRNNK